MTGGGMDSDNPRIFIVLYHQTGESQCIYPDLIQIITQQRNQDTHPHSSYPLYNEGARNYFPNDEDMTRQHTPCLFSTGQTGTASINDSAKTASMEFNAVTFTPMDIFLLTCIQ